MPLNTWQFLFDPKINTMIIDMLQLNIMVKHFTGNRVQVMVQLDMIYNINSKYTKGEILDYYCVGSQSEGSCYDFL